MRNKEISYKSKKKKKKLSFNDTVGINVHINQFEMRRSQSVHRKENNVIINRNTSVFVGGIVVHCRLTARGSWV